MLASFKGHAAIVKTLLQAGANIKSKNKVNRGHTSMLTNRCIFIFIELQAPVYLFVFNYCYLFRVYSPLFFVYFFKCQRMARLRSSKHQLEAMLTL